MKAALGSLALYFIGLCAAQGQTRPGGPPPLSGLDAAQPPSGSRHVPHSDLCVTEGRIIELPDRRAAVDTPKMRAYVNGPSADAIELRFTYRGATAWQSALGSGAVRQQFGLKLRAGDACNLVYVMWRVQPEPKIVASVKINAGRHSSAECGNHGYQDIEPTFSAAVPALKPGDAHRLRADIQGDRLRAFVDGNQVWSGPLGPGAALTGPVGLRTDNVRLEFDVTVDRPQGFAPEYRLRCKTGSGEAE